MNYEDLFDTAFSNTIRDYSNHEILFYSERDLQAHLFYECRRIMEKECFPKPLKLYAEKAVFSRHSKVDLVLGDNEVLVELKLEPVYPGVPSPVIFTWKKGNPTSIEGDLEKVAEYAKRGAVAHFIVIDESGRHAKSMRDRPWIPIYVNQGQNRKVVQCLHMKLRQTP